jgi:hypothetical protein
MKISNKSNLAMLAVMFFCAAITRGADSQTIDQRQIEWFGVSTLKNVKEVYPQVALEIAENNSAKSNFTSLISHLTQKSLQLHLEQLLLKSGVRVNNKFNATAANAPLSLNVTIFAKVRDDTALPSYAIFIYTEALQPGMLLRDNKIRSFSRIWPMVPTGDGTRALLFLTPETIVDEITREVTRQIRSFLIDYSNANPSMSIKIPELIKQNETNDSLNNENSPIPVIDNTSDSRRMKTGKVTRVQIEGGFWGIIGDDGTKYDPINLPEEYKKNGLPVRFEVKNREGMASIHMWGQIVEIIKIENVTN